MPYITQIELQNRFGADEVLQRNDPLATGAVDAAMLNARIADIDAEIDNYLGQQYALPLATVPAMVKRIAGDLVRHRYFEDSTAPDPVMNASKEAKIMLDKYARGVLRLPDLALAIGGQNTRSMPMLSQTKNRPLQKAAQGYRDFGDDFINGDI